MSVPSVRVSSIDPGWFWICGMIILCLGYEWGWFKYPLEFVGYSLMFTTFIFWMYQIRRGQ